MVPATGAKHGEPSRALNKHNDAAYVASLVAPCAERYLDPAADAESLADGETGRSATPASLSDLAALRRAQEPAAETEADSDILDIGANRFTMGR